jgi:hypothetical protein
MASITSPGSRVRNDGGRYSSNPSRSTQAEARIAQAARLAPVVGHHDRQFQHQLVLGLVQLLDQLRLLGRGLVVVLAGEIAHRHPARQLGLLGPGLKELRRPLTAGLVRRQAVIGDRQHRVALALGERKHPVALDHVEQIRLLQLLQSFPHRDRPRHHVTENLLVELGDIQVRRLQPRPAAELADDAAERDSAVPRALKPELPDAAVAGPECVGQRVVHGSIEPEPEEARDVPAPDRGHGDGIDPPDRAGVRQPELAIDGRLVLPGVDEAPAAVAAEQALLDLERLGVTGEEAARGTDDHPSRGAIVGDAGR